MSSFFYNKIENDWMSCFNEKWHCDTYGIRVIIAGNGLSDQSSNLEQGCLFSHSWSRETGK